LVEKDLVNHLRSLDLPFWQRRPQRREVCNQLWALRDLSGICSEEKLSEEEGNVGKNLRKLL
jgi:hypothetical protein